MGEAGHVVLRTRGGAPAMSLLRSEPRLAVLLAYTPASFGLEMCRVVRSAAPSAPLVAIGVGNDERFGCTILQAGADVYLPGTSSPELVGCAVEALVRRVGDVHHTIDWPERVVLNELELDLAGGMVRMRGQKIELTPSEFRILRHLAVNAGRVVSNELLASEALGHTTNRKDASDVMKVHVRHLREKLETDPSKPVYLVNVRGLGYRLERRRPRRSHPTSPVLPSTSPSPASSR